MTWSKRKARDAGAADRSRTPVAASVVAVLVVAALAMGAAGGFLLTRSRIPDAVVSSVAPGALQATAGEYADPRNVTVTMRTGAGQTIASPVGGVVTATRCEPGVTLESGGSLIDVNGIPVLALHSAVPPYRDLKPGDKGSDVAALNDELRRLGRNAPSGNAMTQSTVNAFNAVAKAVGAATATKELGSVIPANAAAWMERASATVESCLASLGATIAPGDPLIVTAGLPQPAAVSIAEQPELEGARSIAVDGQRFPLVADATQIADQSILDAILASSAYRQAKAVADAGPGGSAGGGMGAGGSSGSSIAVTLKWSLDTPVTVWTVSPSSLYDVDRSQACLVSDGKPTTVRIVASELGKTMVSAENGATIGNVAVEPDGGTPCR